VLLSLEEKRQWIETEHKHLSVASQCRLIGLARASYYYEAVKPGEVELLLMKKIDEIYTACPFYGSRKIVIELKKGGYMVNRKRVQGLMREMGLAGIHPGPNTSRRNTEHKVFPYLLKGLKILEPLKVWSTDITFIRLPSGFVYLVAIMDWFSRMVLAYRLSNSLEAAFCLDALEEALKEHGRPEIFNTDQGVQFTCAEFVEAITTRGIRFSMDGKGRALDNIFIERLWRSLKYEEVYLKDYANVNEARKSIGEYFRFYNTKRPHQALAYQTPCEVHRRGKVE